MNYIFAGNHFFTIGKSVRGRGVSTCLQNNCIITNIYNYKTNLKALCLADLYIKKEEIFYKIKKGKLVEQNQSIRRNL